MSEEDKEKKDIKTEEEDEALDIEVVEGNGKGLKISPVYDHIKIDKPATTTDKKKEIIVPKSNNKE